jgi:hypothetical protein
MKNGLYSVHVHMLDGVKGRDSGVLILRDGTMIGGGPYFWSSGSYTVGNRTWKGHFGTNQHTRFAGPSSDRCGAVRKSPAVFPGHSPMTGLKCSELPSPATEA